MKEWVWNTGGKKLNFSGRNLFHWQLCLPPILHRPPWDQNQASTVRNSDYLLEPWSPSVWNTVRSDKVIWYTPSTLEMSAEKHVGLCSCILFPQKLDYSDRFRFNLEFVEVSSVLLELLHDDGQTRCGKLILHIFIADAPEFGVLWEVWFVVTFDVFVRVVSRIEVVLICVFVVYIFSHYV